MKNNKNGKEEVPADLKPDDILSADKNVEPKDNESVKKTNGKIVSEVDKLKQELEEERKKAQDYFERYLRMQADFDNARKRMQRDQQEFVKYANEGIIVELLGVLDDLERSVEAREAKHEDPEAFLKGIEMILSHLYEMLKKNNVKAIEAKGRKFDPHLHEALLQVETNECPDNTVMEELQKGYMLGERVIRTAKVKVSKQKTEDRNQKTEG